MVLFWEAFKVNRGRSVFSRQVIDKPTHNSARLPDATSRQIRFAGSAGSGLLALPEHQTCRTLDTSNPCVKGAVHQTSSALANDAGEHAEDSHVVLVRIHDNRIHLVVHRFQPNLVLLLVI